MNTEELGYYLYMESERLKRKGEKEGLTEREKVNLEINPFWCRKEPPKTWEEKENK